MPASKVKQELSKERDKRIIHLYTEERIAPKYLAVRFDIHKETINAILKRHNVKKISRAEHGW